MTTILGLDVILSLNDLWTFGFFSLSLECLDYGLQLVEKRKKSLVNYALLSFLLKNNGCNIVDGEWMVVKLLVTNKRYFFQEKSHHVLQMLLVCVHAWSYLFFVYGPWPHKALFHFPFTLYFPSLLSFFASMFSLLCHHLSIIVNPFFLQMIKCILFYYVFVVYRSCVGPSAQLWSCLLICCWFCVRSDAQLWSCVLIGFWACVGLYVQLWSPMLIGF